jgi:hypothetical protein
MRRTLQATKEQRGLVEAWKDIPEGTRVVVRLDSGKEYLTKIKAAALMLGNHTAVIWLEGISGCYSLERVRKATEADGCLPNEMALKAERMAR